MSALVEDTGGQTSRLLYGRYRDEEDNARRDHAALIPGAAISRYTVTIDGQTSQHGERQQRDMTEAGGAHSLLHMALWAGLAFAALLYLATSWTRGLKRHQLAAIGELT